MKNILGNKESIECFNKDGNKVYAFVAYASKTFNESTFDSNECILSFKDSKGNFSKWKRDSKGNELSFKNSKGEKRGFKEWLNKFEKISDLLWVTRDGISKDGTVMRCKGSMKELYNNLKK
tara:strand:+ start:181 stop:543 length:363 start_codon:yes stop_codon:yes gene_type:complete